MTPGLVRSLGASSPSPAPGLQESSGCPAPGAWLAPRCIHPCQNPAGFCGHPGELHRLILGCEGASSATSRGGFLLREGTKCQGCVVPQPWHLPVLPFAPSPGQKTPHFGLFLHTSTLPRGCLGDVLMVRVLGFGFQGPPSRGCEQRLRAREVPGARELLENPSASGKLRTGGKAGSRR